ncbi:MAG: hypothetical protein H8E44_24315 [Planctomycetes bacterium]|nr:hypothetical protein [Planctomycetota bacterium]MBL7042818.1 hypothetical protein [Pirellulaceae bacterium]
MQRDDETNSSTRATKAVIRRRPSDFSGRGEVLMYMGTTCCCCCCAHWVGAGIGGTWGIVSAFRDEKEKDPPPIDARAKRYVKMGAAVAAGVTVALVVLSILIALSVRGADDLFGIPLVILAFVPSAFFIPIGIGAMIGAFVAKRRLANSGNEAVKQPTVGGMRLAWRITWKSFLLSSFWAGIGYLLILLFFVIVD